MRVLVNGFAALFTIFTAAGAVFAAAPPPAAVPRIWIADHTARTLALAPGDTVEIAATAGMDGARRFCIGGIYRPGADPFEIGFGRLHLRMHLPDLLQVIGAGDKVDRFVLRTRRPEDAPALARDVNAAGLGLRAYSSAELARDASSTFVVISRFHIAIGAVSLLAGLVFLAALLVLKFEGLRRELAALRLVGVSRRTVMRLVLASAGVITILGSLAGMALAAAAIAVINPWARARYDTDLVFARWDWAAAWLAVGLAIVLGFAAGLAVAARHARSGVLEPLGR